MATIQYMRGATVTLAHSHKRIPASCNVAMYSASGAELFASAAATVDTTSAVIVTGDHGSDTVTVAATAAFNIGQLYRVSDAYGRGIDLVLVGKTATTSLVFNGELPFSVVGGSVKSLKSSKSFTLPDVTYRSVRVVWTSDVEAETDIIDIVRIPFSIPITANDVAEAEVLFTGSASKSINNHMLRAVDDVENWLRGEQIFPDLVIDRSMLRTVAIWRTLYLRHMRDEGLRMAFEKELESAKAAFKTSKSWYNSDDDLSGSDVSGGYRHPSPYDKYYDTSDTVPVKYFKVG